MSQQHHLATNPGQANPEHPAANPQPQPHTAHHPGDPAQARSAEIDLAAIRHNVATLVAKVAPAKTMVVVKADAYGHGALPVALAAQAGGAHLIGTAHLTEALKLRDEGLQGELAAWLHTVDAPFEEALAADIQIGISGWELPAVTAAARKLKTTALVHLKVDTGLGRNGCSLLDWPTLLRHAAEAEAAGTIKVVGIFSHLAASEELDHPATPHQLENFEQALNQAAAAGITPQYRHIANSAAAIAWPQARYDLVRIGLSTYGLSPFAEKTPAQLELIPAMTLRSRVANVKRVATGTGVSYGWRYHTHEGSTLALIPMGYADGIPRSASAGPVQIHGITYHAVGTVAMDQFALDLSEHQEAPEVNIGDEAILFGPEPAPSASDWADAAGTINYEIVTRIMPRTPRRYRNAELRFRLPTAAATTAVAARLATQLEPGDGLILSGELGAGKTTFTQGLAAGMGIDAAITSPTFVLARHHDNPAGIPLVHVDAYRLADAAELYDIDLDQSAPTSVTVVEWGRGKAEELFDSWLDIELIRATGTAAATTDFSEEDVDEPREMIIRPHGPRFASYAAIQALHGLGLATGGATPLERGRA